MPGLKAHHRRWWGWFRPNHLTSLALWVDPTRQTEADGAVVTSLVNYGVDSINFTQASAPAKALMRRATQNGMSAIELDGVDDYYGAGDVLDCLTANVVVFVAHKPVTTGVAFQAWYPICKGQGSAGAIYNGSFDILMGKNTPGTSNCISEFVDSGSQLNYSQYNSPTFDAWQTLAAVGNRGASHNQFIDGVQRRDSGSGFTAAGGSCNNSLNAFIGKDHAGAGYFYKGFIGEICVFFMGSAMTTQQRQKVEGYICHRWGTNPNMSGSHPYYYYPS